MLWCRLRLAANVCIAAIQNFAPLIIIYNEDNTQHKPADMGSYYFR